MSISFNCAAAVIKYVIYTATRNAALASKMNGKYFRLNVLEDILSDFMFEQELYKYVDAQEAKAEPGDLFYQYEVKPWVLGPRLYKIIGVSAILNLLVLAVFAQGNLLTLRGCDSPFVGRVCEVLDTVYVATAMFGTEREYVDAAYEKSELENADITYIDVSNVDPPLAYPEGYFQIANPEQFAMQQIGIESTSSYTGGIPGFPTNPTITDDLINTPPKLPKTNPNPVTGGIPDYPFGTITGDNPTSAAIRKNDRGGRIKAPANASTGAVAQNDGAKSNTNTNTNTNPADPNAAQADEAKADEFGVYINKRPLKDYAKGALEKVDSKAVKLDNSFKVVVAGSLGIGKDGKTIILKNPKPVPTQVQPNDPVLVKLVQDAILAVGDAGWFGYLDKLKAKNVTITVEQNNDVLVASVRADQPTESDAKQAASGLNTLLAIAVPAAKGDDQTFLKQASVTSEGKTFVLNFNIPKPLAQEMIMRKLAESKQPKTEPNSTAVVSQDGKSASK